MFFNTCQPVNQSKINEITIKTNEYIQHGETTISNDTSFQKSKGVGRKEKEKDQKKNSSVQEQSQRGKATAAATVDVRLRTVAWFTSAPFSNNTFTTSA